MKPTRRDGRILEKERITANSLRRVMYNTTYTRDQKNGKNRQNVFSFAPFLLEELGIDIADECFCWATNVSYDRLIAPLQVNPQKQRRVGTG